MARLTFEGEFQELSVNQVQLIRDVLDKRGYEDNTVLFEPVGKQGDNYGADVKRITVIGKGDDNNFSMIAKIAPRLDTLREVMNTALIFNNESVMYSEVLPKFTEIQNAIDETDSNKLIYPECYGHITQAPDEIILLQDLKSSGFVILDKTKPLENNAVKMVLKNFAILHSLSYALKKLEPDSYDSLKNKLVDMWNQISAGPNSYAYFAETEKTILGIFQGEDIHRNHLRRAVTNGIKINQKLFKHDKNSKFSVIQQGDGWTNNLMFKLQDETPKECIMIDYQVSREASPACDILYTIFNSTDYKTRAEHFTEWLDYYHEQLDKLLNNFGLRANFVYSRDQLDADIRRYAKVYFGIALIVLQVILRKPEEATAMKDAMNDNDTEKIQESTAFLSSDTTALFSTRVTELIDSCQELGLL